LYINIHIKIGYFTSLGLLHQEQKKDERFDSQGMCTTLILKQKIIQVSNKYILIFKLKRIMDSIINNNYVKSYAVRVAVDHNMSDMDKRMRTR
jgi:hypothetical protein